MAHKLSSYQQSILTFIREDSRSLIIQARAGSGKTTMLTLIHDEVKAKRVVFLAFNKMIAEELKRRGIANSSTFHSLGFAAIRPPLERINGRRWNFKTGMDADKVGGIFDRMYGAKHVLRSAVLRVVSLIKNDAMLPKDVTVDYVADMVAHFDIELPKESTLDELHLLATESLRENNRVTDRIDFDDMLYFVLVHGAQVQPYDYVLVDESQDTNRMQRFILHNLLSAKGRLVAVGDPAQAIYGFRGAAHDSMERIATEFDCVTLPLSISYRCPASVIREAQTIVPDIQARENAPEGSVLAPAFFKRSEFVPTDLLVCRNTAPLVQTAYKLLASRIPCKILGREIGRGLTSLIKKLAGRSVTTLEALSEKLNAYRDKEVAYAMAAKKEQKAQAIADKCDSILALIGSMTEDDIARGIPGLIAIIDDMFADKVSNVITLATVHKSKGLEAPRVFIVDRSLMPSKYARQAWQMTQESNLQYVAITRALDTLVYVDSCTIID